MTKWTDHGEEDYLTPREAAGAIRVSTRTLARMAERGDIEVMQLPSGHRRYKRADIDRLTGAAA